MIVLPRTAEFGRAHILLDVLGTTLSDRFGSMRLDPPTAYEAVVMLRARVAGPDAEAFRVALESMLRTVVDTFVGTDAPVATAVAPVRPRGPAA